MNGFNNYNGNFNNGNVDGMQDHQQQRCYVVVNVADMIRETFNGIIALNASLGGSFQQASLQQGTLTPQPLQLLNVGNLGQGSFTGIYNLDKYGVYDDPLRLNQGLQFIPGYSMMIFETYEEALHYARNGIANTRGVPVDEIPNMRYSINWMERL